MSNSEPIHNVFDALGLEDAEETIAKCDLAVCIFRIGEERKLTDAALAEIVGCLPERMALLHATEVDDFSIEELSRYLVALGQNVRITVEPTRESEAHFCVAS
ncbi:MAG: helix-turn-helix domain-containing protein [Candidatus Hydrogenedentes bacterium]|nr:helix-turn-helix domain-containing protein [Candidatus Hydrogenedentota bacterium]